MVAYGFKASFVAPIEAGTKWHTLRNPRKRHARAGEEVQLFEGLRTRACRLVAEKTCSEAIGVLLRVSGYRRDHDGVFVFPVAELVPGLPKRAGPLVGVTDREAFAIADGFPDFATLGRWWRRTHKTTSWEGILINWGPPYLAAGDGPVPFQTVPVPGGPPPWQAEPFAWRPPAIAEALRTGGWARTGDGAGFRFASRIDPRVLSTRIGDGGAVEPVYGFAGEVHAGLDGLAEALLRRDRDAAAEREWAA